MLPLVVALWSFHLPWSSQPPSAFESIRTAPFNPIIHNLGNEGWFGARHAEASRFATWVIDQVAYDGLNMRATVADGMASVLPAQSTLVEVGCGTGTLTEELERSGTFDIVAVDTSAQMLRVARNHVKNSTRLVLSNGVDIETVLFDQNITTAAACVVCMVMHELPPVAHVDLLNACRIVANEVWVIDIDPDYIPSAPMLSGEPYVERYLACVEETVEAVAATRGDTVETFEIVPGHVRGWVMR
jgi:SAM-dependent methyltransferase